MKKIPWIYALLSFFLGTLIVGFTFKGWDWLPKENYIFNFDTLISFSGVIVSVIAILFVVRNTNRQITNQNKESHRPYIIMYKGSDIGPTGWTDNKRSFVFENVGLGICTNVMVWVEGTTEFLDDVKKGARKAFNIDATQDEDVNVIILYSDLFDNIYACVIIYAEQKVKIYQQNSPMFLSIVKNIDYKNIVDKYKEDTRLKLSK